MDSERILMLFDNVLSHELFNPNISVERIKLGIESMKDVYSPLATGALLKVNNVFCFVLYCDDPAVKCAYLHKYAALHTEIVQSILTTAIKMNYSLFYDIIFSQNSYSVCCLGGGPGNDAIAVSSALHFA